VVKRSSGFEVKNHSYDPTLYPAGKSIFSILMEGNWITGKIMERDSDDYRSLKQKILEDVIGALSERFPQIRSQIEVTDVPPPSRCALYRELERIV